MDRAQGRPAQRDRLVNRPQVATRQGHIRRFDGDICAAAYREADIRLRQGRRVIDAIANHCHARAPLLELLYAAGLLARQDLCQGLLYADLTGDDLGGALVVAADHTHLQATPLQRLDGGSGCRLDRIADGQRASQCIVYRQQHHREAPALRVIESLRQGGDVDAAFADETLAAQQDESAVYAGGDAAARDSFKVLQGQQLDAARLGFVQQGQGR